MMLSMGAILILFLSTLSLRRATLEVPARAFLISYFYPRSPCGERLSIERCSLEKFKFLSTLSLRRATIIKKKITFVKFNFYPRSPCGERLKNIKKALARH